MSEETCLEGMVKGKLQSGYRKKICRKKITEFRGHEGVKEVLNDKRLAKGRSRWKNYWQVIDYLLGKQKIHKNNDNLDYERKIIQKFDESNITIHL